MIYPLRILAVVLLASFPIVTLAQTVPQGKLFAYDDGCLATNNVLVEDFGTLTPGIAADSTQRAANTTAINAAIAAAPAGGSVCLPADSLYLTLDRVPTSYSSEGIILIARDSVALWGAGACGWGNMGGCSYIGTPGDQYYYRGPVNDDGKDHLVRGFGIKLVKPSGVNTLPNITLKGFELDGQSGWTGCYSFSYDWLYSAHWNCWDMGHKGIGIGSLADNLLIEDVKVHSYKGEIIYGNEPGKVVLRRVWSYDTNGSSFNVATPLDGLVEYSKFGPEVRFWSEHLADLISNAKTTFRYNEFVDCRVVNGCIALPFYNQSATVAGQVWTWEYNTFTNIYSHRPAFLIETGPYELNITNNTFENCPLAFFNRGGGGKRATINISDNVLHHINDWSFIFQGAVMQGLIARNSFRLTNAERLQAWSQSPPADLKGLIIENNTFDNFKTPGGARYALIRNNTYLNFSYVADKIGGDNDHIIQQYDENRAVTSSVESLSAVLSSVYVPDMQPLKLWNAGSKSFVLSADSVQHGWEEDIVMAPGDTINIVFDAETSRWYLADQEIPEPPSDTLTGDNLGSGSGSHTAPATGRYQITGRGQGIYRTQREGYALRKPIADGDSFSVQIDSLTTWEGPYERLQGGGIVISDSTSATSPGLYVLYRPLSQWLVVWHAQSESTVPVFAGLARIKEPFTVKVNRTGTAYTVSYSSDGETFTQLAEVNLTLTRPFVGPFASSNNAGADTVLHVSGVE